MKTKRVIARSGASQRACSGLLRTPLARFPNSRGSDGEPYSTVNGALVAYVWFPTPSFTSSEKKYSPGWVFF
jgi:hypothetical protein